jgi:hypothetical protein
VTSVLHEHWAQTADAGTRASHRLRNCLGRGKLAVEIRRSRLRRLRWQETYRQRNARCPRVALNLVDQIASGCIDAVYLALYEGISPDQISDDFTSKVSP